MRAHDKKVRPRQFQKGELVLKRIPQNQQDPRGKWSPNWEGPYVVKKAFSGRALILAKMDGKEFSNPINVDIVKKYYAWGNQEKWLAKVENLKGWLWQVKQKQKRKEKEEEEKMFKVKTRKDDLNHKKEAKKKGQVENLKRRLDQEKRFLDWKPEWAV